MALELQPNLPTATAPGLSFASSISLTSSASFAFFLHASYALTPVFATHTHFKEGGDTAKDSNARTGRKENRPLFSYSSALSRFPYPATSVFATLTKTTGVYPISSQKSTAKTRTPFSPFITEHGPQATEHRFGPSILPLLGGLS
jgi:hypothetical protein